MNNLQQSMLEAEQLRREEEQRLYFEQPWIMAKEPDDQAWLEDEEVLQWEQEYRDERDTLAALLQF